MKCRRSLVWRSSFGREPVRGPTSMRQAAFSSLLNCHVPESFRIAAVQACPVYFDRDRTLDKACRLIEEAGRGGAQLAVFPEAFVPGYPLWVWFIPPGHTAALREAYVTLHENAIAIPSRSTDRLCDAARSAGIAVAIGVNERNAEASDSTLYNTLLVHRSGRRHSRKAPQAGSDRGRTPRLGLRRRQRPRGLPATVRPCERADLLGELHASGALRARGVGRSDSCGSHVGPGRAVVVHDATRRAKKGGPLSSGAARQSARTTFRTPCRSSRSTSPALRAGSIREAASLSIPTERSWPGRRPSSRRRCMRTFVPSSS